MQGALDDNVLPSLQEKFAASYRAAGGECQLEIFENCEHLWVDKPGPMTDKAHEMVKGFIARNLGKLLAVTHCLRTGFVSSSSFGGSFGSPFQGRSGRQPLRVLMSSKSCFCDTSPA